MMQDVVTFPGDHNGNRPPEFFERAAQFLHTALTQAEAQLSRCNSEIQSPRMEFQPKSSSDFHHSSKLSGVNIVSPGQQQAPLQKTVERRIGHPFSDSRIVAHHHPSNQPYSTATTHRGSDYDYEPTEMHPVRHVPHAPGHSVSAPAHSAIQMAPTRIMACQACGRQFTPERGVYFYQCPHCGEIHWGEFGGSETNPHIQDARERKNQLCCACGIM